MKERRLRNCVAGASTLLLLLPIVFNATSLPAQSQTLRERFQSRRVAGQDKEGGDTTKFNIAGLDVAVWKPINEGKAPLVIFSHGFGGSNTQSVYIMKALAQAGYLVMAPNHKDAHGLQRMQFKPQVSFVKPKDWTDQTYQDRRQDIVNLLDALHADPTWDSQIDWTKLALSGHSLGGYTALGLAGAWPSWKLDGVKAVLALSPYVGPFIEGGGSGHLDGLGLPVMYQGGTKDTGITPFLKRSGGAFDKTDAPVIFVEFDGFTHFSWTGFNNNQGEKDLADYYCVSFLDKYVRGKGDADPKKKLPGVTLLEQK